jgi:hypothetical protein
MAETLLADFRRGDPWTTDPWRIVTGVLLLTTFQLRDPFAALVGVESYVFLLRRDCTS